MVRDERSITDSQVSTDLIEESMNRAFGLFVNELRLKTLRRRQGKIRQRVSIERLMSQSVKFIAGQFGHEDGQTELTPVLVSPDRLRKALDRAAVNWKFTIDGDEVIFIVDAPKLDIPPRS